LPETDAFFKPLYQIKCAWSENVPACGNKQQSESIAITAELVLEALD